MKKTLAAAESGILGAKSLPFPRDGYFWAKFKVPGDPQWQIVNLEKSGENEFNISPADGPWMYPHKSIFQVLDLAEWGPEILPPS
jgi:hypothetical protein